MMDADRPGFTRDGWKKLIKPVVFGLSGYFGGEFLPKIIDSIINGTPSTAEIVAVRIPGLGYQLMLWDRLFPNPTYSPGILCRNNLGWTADYAFHFLGVEIKSMATKPASRYTGGRFIRNISGAWGDCQCENWRRKQFT
ncbi:MAG: hypothetical protein AB9891_11145 [Anaerolineaceae bacterium]